MFFDPKSRQDCLAKAEKDWIIVEEKLQFFQDKENVDGDNFF
jgi:hypothetical protein